MRRWNACPQARSSSSACRQAAAWYQPRRGLLFQPQAVGFAKMPTSALALAFPISNPMTEHSSAAMTVAGTDEPLCRSTSARQKS